MDMKRKVFLSSLLLAILILLVEIFVLDDYLPSVRPSKRYYEKLKKQSKNKGRVHFYPFLGANTHNRSVKTKQHVKAATRRPATVPIKTTRSKSGFSSQNRNLELQLSSKLMDKVNALKRRKVRKKTQGKLRGESKEIIGVNAQGQKRLRQPGARAKSKGLPPKNGKLVLIYTPLFDDLPWKGIRNSFQFTHFRGAPCPVTNCSLTYKHRLFSRSDVVIFHGQDMPPIYELEELNYRRPKGQIWVYFVLENPSNARETYYFEDMFNWTMTYEKNSDIYLPYGSYAALEPGEKSPYEEIIPGKKDRLVVWTVSNCGGLRDWYVQELRNYIRVDIFGSCAEYIYQPDLQEEECPRNTQECKDLIKRYKFQLAFENGNCVDYLTEKYWGTPLELGIVPVVMGGANYSQMAIPGSYINVLDFDSVKDLADYLLYLDKNDTAYMEYFAWRKTYRVYGYLKGAVFNEHYPWTCNMCAKAQNPGSKSYGSLSDYRNPSTLCELNEDKLYDMVRPGGDTGFMNRYTQQNEIYGVDENPTDDEEGEDEEGEEEEGDEEGEDEEDEDEDEDVNGEEAVTGERVKELVKREKGKDVREEKVEELTRENVEEDVKGAVNVKYEKGKEEKGNVKREKEQFAKEETVEGVKREKGEEGAKGGEKRKQGNKNVKEGEDTGREKEQSIAKNEETVEEINREDKDKTKLKEKGQKTVNEKASKEKMVYSHVAKNQTGDNKKQDY